MTKTLITVCAAALLATGCTTAAQPTRMDRLEANVAAGYASGEISQAEYVNYMLGINQQRQSRAVARQRARQAVFNNLQKSLSRPAPLRPYRVQPLPSSSTQSIRPFNCTTTNDFGIARTRCY